MNYSNEELLAMYRTMVKGRIYEETMWEYNQKGRFSGMLHLSIGQEAIGTAVAFALHDDEPFLPSHRSRPLHLHRMDMYKYMSEEVGSRNGLCGGISGDTHIYDLDIGFLPIPGVLGANAPIAAGAALALKHKSPGKAMMMGMGDGTFNEGAIYEAINWACVRQLPLVFLVENNELAYSTTNDKCCITENVTDRAKGFGLDVVVVDGNDVLAMRDAMEAALELARKESKPTVIEAKTYRVTGHFNGDTQWYLDPEWHQAMLEKHPDPIPRYEKILLEKGLLTEEEIIKIKDELKEEITGVCDRIYDELKDPANHPRMEDILDPNVIYATQMEGLL